MIKKLLIVLITTLALNTFANAGSNEELILKKMNHQK